MDGNWLVPAMVISECNDFYFFFCRFFPSIFPYAYSSRCFYKFIRCTVRDTSTLSIAISCIGFGAFDAVKMAKTFWGKRQNKRLPQNHPPTPRSRTGENKKRARTHTHSQAAVKNVECKRKSS